MAFFHELPDEKKRKRMEKRNASWEEGSGYRQDRGANSRNSDKGAREDEMSGLSRQKRNRPTAGFSGGKSSGRGNGAGRYSQAEHFGEPRKMYNTARNEQGNRSFYSQEKERRSEQQTREDRPEREYDCFRDYEYRKNESDLKTDHETHDAFVLTGRNPIREALKSGRDLEKLLVQKGELSGSAREIVAMAKDNKIMVQVVEKSRLDEVSPHHQGLIAIASAYQYASMEELYAAAKDKGEDPFFILLDGITDPHNLGAIIRTAECVGAHGVIVPQHRSVGLTPAAVKASAGAVEHVKVARVTNLNRTIEELQKKGIWVYGLSMDGEDYEKVTFEGGVALVIGAEGDGISRLTSDKCDQIISLPICGAIDSLNASVAAGIMMYKVLSCRRKKA